MKITIVHMKLERSNKYKGKILKRMFTVEAIVNDICEQLFNRKGGWNYYCINWEGTLAHIEINIIHLNRLLLSVNYNIKRGRVSTYDIIANEFNAHDIMSSSIWLYDILKSS